MSGVAASARRAASGVRILALVRATSTVLTTSLSSARVQRAACWLIAWAGQGGASWMGRSRPAAGRSRGRRPAAMAGRYPAAPRLAPCDGPAARLGWPHCSLSEGQRCGRFEVINALALPGRSSGSLRPLARGMAARRPLALLQACRDLLRRRAWRGGNGPLHVLSSGGCS